MTSQEAATLTVVSWNILLDKTRTKQGLIKPQSERLVSQIDTLVGLPVPLDVVTIQEVEKTHETHHGEQMSRALGYTAGHWAEHNTTKRRGEHIGMFGRFVDDVDFVSVGHDKLAVLTCVSGIAIAGIHHRNERVGPKRTHQMAALLEYMEPYDRAIIAGDTNALSFEKSRRMVGRAGYRSAFRLAGQVRPATFPTPAYRDIMYGRTGSSLFRRAVSIDDIYLKGLGVHDAGVFVGDSDHYGLWATIKR